jgi:RES domain-containing protein
MPMAWRLSSPDYATRLDGKGNVQRGARWNSPGRGVVYASINLSLAVLESLAQLPPELRAGLPELRAVRIGIPDDLASGEISRDELPGDLTGEAAARRCRELGDAWLGAGRFLALSVPSVIVPQERNLLINPAHASIDSVTIISVEPFRFDQRSSARLDLTPPLPPPPSRPTGSCPRPSRRS